MEAAHTGGFDPFDLDRLRIPPGAVPGLRKAARPPRHRPGESFLKGPIPYEWIATACRLPGSGLHVATSLRFLQGRFRRPNRWGLSAIAKGLVISERTAQRGLHAAEEAGLLIVEREPGCKLSASVAPWPAPASEPGRPPLYGPIPWAWWLVATRLPGAALQVASACWLMAGWDRLAEVELALGDWSDLGLARQAARRGLDHLQSEGLVAVSDRPGRPPSVVILDPPSFSPCEGPEPCDATSCYTIRHS